MQLVLAEWEESPLENGNRKTHEPRWEFFFSDSADSDSGSPRLAKKESWLHDNNNYKKNKGTRKMFYHCRISFGYLIYVELASNLYICRERQVFQTEEKMFSVVFLCCVPWVIILLSGPKCAIFLRNLTENTEYKFRELTHWK